MNKRIRELAAQVEKWISTTNFEGMPEDEMTYDEIFQKKFAELIVQECAQVCLSQRDPANLNYKPSERFAEAVKQHFGVE